jgi:hypothetical protein
MWSRCCVCVSPIFARQRLDENSLLLLVNGSVEIPLSLLGNGTVETLP